MSSRSTKRTEQTYIVATIKPWNVREFDRRISRYPGKWHLISDPAKLTPSLIRKLRPRYVFFPHWSWKVPEQILEEAECICFHETDLPYGRGGSPIQNLIARGHTRTVISALRMEQDLDSGPIYLQRRVSLSGTAQEIFERNARVVADMIRSIISKDITPKPQRGRAVIFKRRAPDQSNIASLEKMTPKVLYDHIRMLDAETYPRAYLEVGGLRFEFSKPKRRGDSIEALVTITPA